MDTRDIILLGVLLVLVFYNHPVREGNVTFQNKLYSEKTDLLNQVNTDITNYNSDNSTSIDSVDDSSVVFSTGGCTQALGSCTIQGIPGQCISHPTDQKYMCQVTTNTIGSINQDTADTQVIVTPTDDTYHYVISKSGEQFTHSPYCSDSCSPGDPSPECCINKTEWTQIYTSTINDDLRSLTPSNLPETLYPSLNHDNAVIYTLPSVDNAIITDVNPSIQNKVFLDLPESTDKYYTPTQGFFINQQEDYSYDISLFPGYITSQANSQLGVQGFYEQCMYETDETDGTECSCPENTIGSSPSLNPNCETCPEGTVRHSGDTECQLCREKRMIATDGNCSPCEPDNQLQKIYVDDDPPYCESVSSSLIRSDCLSDTGIDCSSASYHISGSGEVSEYYSTCNALDTCLVYQHNLGSDLYDTQEHTTLIQPMTSLNNTVIDSTLYHHELCGQLLNETTCNQMTECLWDTEHSKCTLQINEEPDTTGCFGGVFIPLSEYGVYDQTLTHTTDTSDLMCASISQNEVDGYSIPNLGNNSTENFNGLDVTCASGYVGTPQGHCFNDQLSVTGCIPETDMNNLLLSPSNSRLDQACDELCHAYPSLCSSYSVYKPETLYDLQGSEQSYGCLLLPGDQPCEGNQECFVSTDDECDGHILGEETYCCLERCSEFNTSPPPGMQLKPDYTSFYLDDCYVEQTCSEYYSGDSTCNNPGWVLDTTKTLADFDGLELTEDTILDYCCAQLMCDSYMCPDTMATNPSITSSTTPQGTDPTNACCVSDTCENDYNQDNCDSTYAPVNQDNLNTNINDMTDTQKRDTCCPFQNCSTFGDQCDTYNLVNKQEYDTIPVTIEDGQSYASSTFQTVCCEQPTCGYLQSNSIYQCPSNKEYDSTQDETMIAMNETDFSNTCCLDLTCDNYVCEYPYLTNEDVDVDTPQGSTPDTTCCTPIGRCMDIIDQCPVDTIGNPVTAFDTIYPSQSLDTNLTTCCQDQPTCGDYECSAGFIPITERIDSPLPPSNQGVFCCVRDLCPTIDQGYCDDNNPGTTYIDYSQNPYYTYSPGNASLQNTNITDKCCWSTCESLSESVVAYQDVCTSIKEGVYFPNSTDTGLDFAQICCDN